MAAKMAPAEDLQPYLHWDCEIVYKKSVKHMWEERSFSVRGEGIKLGALKCELSIWKKRQTSENGENRAGQRGRGRLADGC